MARIPNTFVLSSYSDTDLARFVNLTNNKYEEL